MGNRTGNLLFLNFGFRAVKIPHKKEIKILAADGKLGKK